jgi:hypothetical protein
MPVRDYSGNAKSTTLVGTISATATSILLADAVGYPTGTTGPFVITVDAGAAAEEKVLCASRTGNTITVATGGRGWDGTTASDHDNGASIRHTFSATDAREANAHVNQTTDMPHGGAYLTPADASAAYAPRLARGVKARQTVAQSIAHATETALQLATEDFDTNAFHDNATNNTRLTIPAGMGGLYALSGAVSYAANATGTRQARWRVNGTALINGGVNLVPASPSGLTIVQSTVFVRLAAGDFVELYGIQDSGAALNTEPAFTDASLLMIGA